MDRENRAKAVELHEAAVASHKAVITMHANNEHLAAIIEAKKAFEFARDALSISTEAHNDSIFSGMM
jgi:phosphohistidine swiveling domain-containing protein